MLLDGRAREVGRVLLDGRAREVGRVLLDGRAREVGRVLLDGRAVLRVVGLLELTRPPLLPVLRRAVLTRPVLLPVAERPVMRLPRLAVVPRELPELVTPLRLMVRGFGSSPSVLPLTAVRSPPVPAEFLTPSREPSKARSDATERP